MKESRGPQVSVQRVSLYDEEFICSVCDQEIVTLKIDKCCECGGWLCICCRIAVGKFQYTCAYCIEAGLTARTTHRDKKMAERKKSKEERLDLQ